MATNSLLRAHRALQLLVCGAIVGLYVAKAVGIGLDLPHVGDFETMGATVGAALVGLAIVWKGHNRERLS